MKLLKVIDTWDLGGEVTSADELLAALAKCSLIAHPSDILGRSFDEPFVALREPVVEIQTDLSIDEDIAGNVQRHAERVRLYPTGVIVVTWTFACDANMTLGGMADVAERFRVSRSADYMAWLRAGASKGSSSHATHPGGVLTPFSDYVRTIGQIRRAARSAVRARPYLLAPFGTKYIHVVGDERPLTNDLAEFAEHQGEVASEPNEPQSAVISVDERIRRYGGAVIASWGGRHFLVRLDSDRHAMMTDIEEAFELVETYRLISRIWIDYLDRVRPSLSGSFGEAELAVLEKELLEVSILEQRISYTMIELDAIELAAVSAIRRRLLLDMRDRLRLGELQQLIDRRVDAMHVHSQMIKSVMDRVASEATRRHGDKLQMLFSGAVAATVLALVPAVAGLDAHQRTTIGIATACLTVLAWIALIIGVRRFSRVEVSFDPPVSQDRGTSGLAEPQAAEDGDDPFDEPDRTASAGATPAAKG